MACRGCSSSDGCGCSVVGDGAGISVTGTGTPVTSPYVVSLDLADVLLAETESDVECDTLSDPRVPVLLGTGNVVMYPLPCNEPLAAALPGNAFAFTYDGDTGGAPADGTIQFDDADYSLVTAIYVSEEEINGTAIGGWLDSVNDITGSPLATAKLYSRTDPTVWASYAITYGESDGFGVYTFDVTYIDHAAGNTFDSAIIGDTVLDITPASEGSTGGFDSVQTIEAVTGAYTLDLADAGKYLRCGNASSFSVTVPPNSTVAFTTGTHIDLIQTLAGQVTIAAGVGVTINATPGLKLNGQWAGATLVKVDTNVWDLVGNLTS